jgi:hypothetical protein
LPKGGLTVVTPPIARKLEIAKVNVDKLPKTVFQDKKDKARVKYFMDLIQRGIVPPPAEIHKRPDGTWEILDGKHRIEAYRRLGYKRIPVVTNATIGEIAKSLGDAYEDELLSQPRSFAEKRELARRAITAQRGNPLVTEDTAGAFDSLNPLSSGDTQVAEILADKKRRIVKSGDLVTGKKSGETWRTRTTGSDAQQGTHFLAEPHGDRTALPRDLSVVVPPMFASPSVPQEGKAEQAEQVEDMKRKMAKLEKQLESTNKELEKAKEETPEQKREREYREKALTIAEHESAKMRERKSKREAKAKAKAEAEKKTKKMLEKAIPNMEKQTMSDVTEYGAEAQLVKRQENWRKRSKH